MFFSALCTRPSPLFSLDHFVRPCQHVRRNRQSDRLSGYEIDDEVQFDRTLDRQLACLCSSEDLVYEARRLVGNLGIARAVAGKSVRGASHARMKYCRE